MIMQHALAASGTVQYSADMLFALSDVLLQE
jgi:hypothetical protein